MREPRHPSLRVVLGYEAAQSRADRGPRDSHRWGFSSILNVRSRKGGVLAGFGMGQKGRSTTPRDARLPRPSEGRAGEAGAEATNALREKERERGRRGGVAPTRGRNGGRRRADPETRATRAEREVAASGSAKNAGPSASTPRRRQARSRPRGRHHQNTETPKPRRRRPRRRPETRTAPRAEASNGRPWTVETLSMQ